MSLKKVYVLGTSGSGKSYLARLISEKLDVPCYDLDDIFWVKKYSEKLHEDKRVLKIMKIAKKKSWVIEGVYASWVSKAIAEADLVIWLRTPAHKRVSRIISRKLKNYDRDSWRGTFGLVRFSLAYRFRKKKASHSGHKELLKNTSVKHIVIKNKKNFNKFLEELN